MQGLLREARRFASLNAWPCRCVNSALSANREQSVSSITRPLAAILPLFLRPVQLPIPLGLNLLLMPGEHVLWSDVADGTVQANVRTSPYYPQSNGKIERWHKSLKSECIRPGTPLSLEDARRLVEGYVEHYNNVRH